MSTSRVTLGSRGQDLVLCEVFSKADLSTPSPPCLLSMKPGEPVGPTEGGHHTVLRMTPPPPA